MKKLYFFLVGVLLISIFCLANAVNFGEKNISSNAEIDETLKGNTVCVVAEAESSLSNTPAAALEYIFTLLNNKQYVEYASLTDCVAKEDAVDNGIRDKRGFFNLQSVSLSRYKDISDFPDAYNGLIEVAEMENAGYTDIHIYTVELNCLTYSEDKYFFDGLNYFMAAIGTDGNVYRLLQFSQPLWCDVPEDARFLGIDENVEIFIQNQRMRGNIIGADGNIIEVNRENRDQKQRSIEIDANAEIPNDSDFEYTGTIGTRSTIPALVD